MFVYENRGVHPTLKDCSARSKHSPKHQSAMSMENMAEEKDYPNEKYS